MTNSATLISMLKELKLTISTAESCTGGLIGKLITDAPGASEVYLGGIVAYSNMAKVKLLNIPQKILDEHTAISPKTACAMAENIKMLTNSNISIATTGNAGPTAADGKEVGEVYISICYKSIFCEKLKTIPTMDRQAIREFAAKRAIELAILSLKGEI